MASTQETMLEFESLEIPELGTWNFG